MTEVRPGRRRAKPRRARRKARQRRTMKLLAYGACIAAVAGFIALGIVATREPASQMPPPIQITRVGPTWVTDGTGPTGAALPDR